MTNPPGRRKSIQPKLAVRLVLILSIAIMPLGLISVYQTSRVLSERQSLSKIALLERTQQAVAETRELIQSAISAAETLAILVKELSPDDDECDRVMARVVQENSEFVFAGFSNSTFGLICASKPGDLGVELPAQPVSMTEQPEQLLVTRPLELLGGIATLSVTVPLVDEGRRRGSIWVTIPVSVLNETLARSSDSVDLVLFQNDGSLIATGKFGDFRRSVLPQGRELSDLAAEDRASFHADNRDGVPRDFAVLPIVEGRVYALGSWEPQLRGVALRAFEEAAALYFPFAMWAVAIAVAYVGIHRLVIRHVRRLRHWMRKFADGQINPDTARLDNAPEELEVLAEAFRSMTRRLSEQDQIREEDLKEKTVLLREVHHRVKNNLQLISSILNMQIRATGSGEARSILRQVQERVLALSAIHRYLYMSRKLSLVRVDELLNQIVEQLVAVSAMDDDTEKIRVEKDFDAVEITPDQSVPLSLLTTEAAMNAVKYCGTDDPEGAWISMSLKKQENGQLRLSVINTCKEMDGDATEVSDRSGLGSRLIKSFVTQLEGKLAIDARPERHELHVVFPLAPPKHDPDDMTN
jgi:two-component sensor histidine kinase